MLIVFGTLGWPWVLVAYSGRRKVIDILKSDCDNLGRDLC